MGSEKGLQVQSMDSSHVALVSLLLRESAFENFKCDRPTSLGMNVDSLGKILKMCGPNDSLKLRWQNDADSVSFQCETQILQLGLRIYSLGVARAQARRAEQGPGPEGAPPKPNPTSCLQQADWLPVSPC